MWGPPMAVSYQAYGDGQSSASHPDLDVRDIQTFLCDRMMETRGGGHCRPASTQGGYSRGRSSSLMDLGDDDGQQGLFVFAPAHEGWLIKRGSHGLKLWRRRWVVMANQTLYYYAGPPARKEDASPGRALASVQLTAMTKIVDDPDELTFQVVAGPELRSPRPGEEGNSPPAPPGTAWHFRAESMPEKMVWLRSLRRCIQIVSWWSRMRIGRELGKGGFSLVQEMEDIRTGERLAVKRIEARTRMERDQAVAEADILSLVTSELGHVPHLMGATRMYVEGNVLWIMFPLCRGGDLFQRVQERKRFSEPDAAVVFEGLLKAVGALHSRHVVHLDVKPENLLFETPDPTDLTIKLADFGLSRRFGEGDAADVASDPMGKHRTRKRYDERINGTIGYMAPEVVLHRRHGPPADVWACGVVLHILLVGYAPFTGRTERETLDRSVRGEYAMDPLDWARISQDARDLVKRLLTVDDSLRITVAEALNHPWVRRFGAKKEVLEPGFEIESPNDANPSRRPLRSLLTDSWTAVLQSPIMRNSVIARLAGSSPTPSSSSNPTPPPRPPSRPPPPPSSDPPTHQGPMMPAPQPPLAVS